MWLGIASPCPDSRTIAATCSRAASASAARSSSRRNPPRPRPQRCSRQRACSCGCIPIVERAEADRPCAPDVIAERHGAQKARPVDAKLSPAANVAGTTAQPGSIAKNSLESSVSSACASIPLMNRPPGTRGHFRCNDRRRLVGCKIAGIRNAARAGGRSDPEIMAAKRVEDMVLRLLDHFIRRARPPASLIYALSLAMTGLTVSAANNPLGNAGRGGHPRVGAGRAYSCPPMFAFPILAFR